MALAGKLDEGLSALMISPGETVEDVLKNRRMTAKELAAKTGIAESYITNVVLGRMPITEKLAERLEDVFDVPMSFWLNLQANYDSEIGKRPMR